MSGRRRRGLVQGLALAGALAAAAVLLSEAEALGEKQPPARPVNVNSASAAELEQLPGIGPAMARAIVQHRARNGPFRRLDELLIIRGMSRAKLRRLRPYLRL